MKEIVQLLEDYKRRHNTIQEELDEARKNTTGSLLNRDKISRFNGKAEAYRSLIAELEKILLAEPETDVIELKNTDGFAAGLYMVCSSPKKTVLPAQEAVEVIETTFNEVLGEGVEDYIQDEVDKRLKEKGIYRIWATEAATGVI